ncbi:uncharacterized protein TrAtP1_004449 [Trichoderma atroviride]|uniref:uncharacterized protein n=1 Tax=Hypocrea atroviridis TaxID=63577 RepID=UPI00331ABC90|nr:hypothetical protein TrAtP1_004449 [Trichoderma atroviride]
MIAFLPPPAAFAPEVLRHFCHCTVALQTPRPSGRVREAADLVFSTPLPSRFSPHCHDLAQASPGQYRRCRRCWSSSLASDILPRRLSLSKPPRRRRLSTAPPAQTLRQTCGGRAGPDQVVD